MSAFRFSFPACVIAGANRISTDEILLLRKYTFPDGVRTLEDARTLLALAHCCPEASPEWVVFFIESLTRYLVQETPPAGAISEAGARWLMRNISDDGMVTSVLELELLLHVMEVSAEVPDSLSAFALDQMRHAIVSRTGAYAVSRPDSRSVCIHDLHYLWRILRGALVRGRLMLSSREAAILKAIDRAAPISEHHPAWREMMALVVTLDRPADDLRSDRWLEMDNLPPLDDDIAA
ncbi:hypothetical protein M0654_01875 [Rhizobium sp. NTR19]|uniref:Uncharacterized protein n=1 Tax=Neorhizobium turbinariae TaxID=2937795 RepID=A0ABT0ILL2_9HYPH|nr:hypothetical protein [Neorhizobium turbinariae]MCK8778721.1 hypothetical protein [Neorhizobium turbinariae]